MTPRDIVKITINLVIIYLAGGLLLAAVYAKTSPVIYQKNLQEKKEALRTMMPTAQEIVKLGDWAPHEKHAEYYSGYEAAAVVEKGKGYAVVWRSRNVEGCVDIELLRDGQAVKSLGQCVPNEGRFPFEAEGLAEGGGYAVRVSSKDGSVSAQSADFAVSSEPAQGTAGGEAAPAAGEKAAEAAAPDAPEISGVMVGKRIGYIVEAFGKGYSSYINVLFSVGDDFKVQRIDVLHHAETPGLGDEIETDWFKGQFEGKDAEHLVVKKAETTEYIQGITGATISSRAVAEDGVRKGLEFLKEAVEKGKGGSEHGSPARED
ncbi:MAG: hypothetical protein Kow0025_25910 [Thermodesulfovibrionales bacterium]